MSTRLTAWGVFWISSLLAIGALAWVSVEVVALEKRDLRSQNEAQRQELIRRALWRMDSQLAPLIAIEASRPNANYERVEQSREQWLMNASTQTPSLDSIQDSTLNFNYANRYFQFDLEQAQEQIAAQISKLDRDQTQSKSTKQSFYPAFGATENDISNSPQASSEYTNQGDESGSDFEARRRVAELATQSEPIRNRLNDSMDANQDSELLDNELNIRLQQRQSEDNQASAFDETESVVTDDGSLDIGSLALMHDSQQSSSAGPVLSALSPQWIQDNSGEHQLMLLRIVDVDQRQVVQGVWLDWPTLRADLLQSVDDLLPGSSLIPEYSQNISYSYRLATIPVRFVPQVQTTQLPWKWSPALVGLLVTWFAIIATIIAVGLVLRAAILLSQRRGMFVSAVTHELRTPLTTFRLYSQMLADGMVSDERVKSEYLGTLKRESERLTGIVENVLEYARLTRHRSSSNQSTGVQTLAPGELVARFRPAMARRASQSNFDLVVSLDLDHKNNLTLTVDPQAVERIMMNLVENACKYAAPQSDRSDQASHDSKDDLEDFDTRIHLDATINESLLELLVADHGPGISSHERTTIFGEFRRGKLGLSNARSGLGLGLALSKGLAKEMGGDLNLTYRRGHGAEFLLTIPLDSNAS